VELAMVQDNVSNAMIGKMRMQFWRDAVKEIREVRNALYTPHMQANMQANMLFN
jgi:hypothetical protein